MTIYSVLALLELNGRRQTQCKEILIDVFAILFSKIEEDGMTSIGLLLPTRSHIFWVGLSRGID